MIHAGNVFMVRLCWVRGAIVIKAVMSCRRLVFMPSVSWACCRRACSSESFSGMRCLLWWLVVSGGCAGGAWFALFVSGCPGRWLLVPVVWVSLGPHLVGGLFACVVSVLGWEQFCGGCVAGMLFLEGVCVSCVFPGACGPAAVGFITVVVVVSTVSRLLWFVAVVSEGPPGSVPSFAMLWSKVRGSCVLCGSCVFWRRTCAIRIEVGAEGRSGSWSSG